MTRLEQLLEMGADQFLEMAAKESGLTHPDDISAFKLGTATGALDMLIALYKLSKHGHKSYIEQVNEPLK